MQLQQHIKDLITQGGSPISMAEFMSLALAHNDYGYYKTKEPFGAKGDFTTSPEISQMFGELMGIWCADIWQQMGCPSDIEIAEIGPGRGTLMDDLLRATRKVQGFHESISVSMVETSLRLRDVQNEKLKGKHPRIKWFDNMSQIPEKPLIIVTNELFDALPVHQYIKKEGKWHEKMLGLNEAGELEFVIARSEVEAEQRGNPELSTREERLLRFARNDEIPEGTILETCPYGITLMQEISSRVKQHGGAALIIDYGYIKPEYKNTISAISNHKHVDVLQDIGHADISAHVDFNLLRSIASEADLNADITYQGEFLRNMGIEIRASGLCKNATEAQKQDIESARDRLIGKGEMQMGELFKVLAVSSGGLAPAGF